MIDVIYLDMDGVVARFVDGVARFFGKTEEDLLPLWPAGSYSIHIPLGLEDEDELWKKVDQGGWPFWASLKPYPWADRLYEELRKIAPVVIATSPSLHPQSAYGKIAWLQKWKGKHFRDYMIVPKKHFLARPGALLVDDSDDKVVQYRERGGPAVLFPQVWNSAHEARKEDAVEYVLARIEDIARAGAR